MNRTAWSKLKIPILALSILLATGLAAQEKKPVSFEMAFRGAGPDIQQRTGSWDVWLDDRHYVWIERDGDTRAYYKVDAKTGKRQAYERPQQPEMDRSTGLARSDDYQQEAWVKDGDIHLLNVASGERRRLTFSKGVERNPTFSPDGAMLGYTRDHNLYVMELATGLERQLTGDGSDLVYNGFASWVYYEEILGRSSRYRAFWWSPDSQSLLYMRFDDHPVGLFSIYHEPGNYGFNERTRYPKAGETNPYVKMGVISAKGGETHWLDFDDKEDAYIAWPFWTPDSQKIHVQWMNRDQNHLIIYECEAAGDGKRPIYEEKQDAWVEYFNDIHYLEDGSGFILRSDKDGWRHLYLHGMDGKLVRRLTAGEWSVTSLTGVDGERGRVYFMANKGDSAGRKLFSVGLDGRGLAELTKAEGSHSVRLSPGFDWFLDTHSSFAEPTKYALYNAKGKLVRVLADRANPKTAEYRQAVVERFTIPNSDGYQMPAYWVIPDDLDRSGQTRHPVIFRIYSGPNAPTVRSRYGWRWRDHYYANNGVITISVDHRASGHFGKKGVAAMHRKLGHWEVLDLIDAVKWLREKPFIDPDRMGIVGHSYGGYMTLLALTKGADYFTHGVSGAPVTDWALYDTVYTERYMDRPQDNPEGYAQGSVLTHADKLRGKLRLLHGTIDDNVHMQNTMQLVDILTGKNIQFELMLYPGSRHRIAQTRHRQDGEDIFWHRWFLDKPFGGDAGAPPTGAP